MTLETDSGHWTVTDETQYDWVLFNDTFSTAPSAAIIFGVVDKAKSVIDAGTITTAGASASSETGTDVRFLAKQHGYSVSGGHPEMDDLTYQPTAEKTNEAVSFNSTFSNSPIVVTGYEGDDPDFKGGKTSAANITTTGCDVATEFKGVTVDQVNVFIIYTNGFWEV